MNSIPPKENPDNQRNDSPVLLPLLTQIPPTPTNTENSCKCCHHKAPWWKTTAEMIGITAVVIYTIVSYNQWGTQIKSIKIDNRPWIAIEDLDAHIQRPDPFFWVIPSLRNAGKSPALDTIVRVNYRILPKGHELTLSDIEFRSEREDPKEWNTYKVGAFNLLRNYWIPRFYFEEEISPTVHEQLMKGDKVFYMFFEVTYKDVFGRRLYTHFCNYYLPKLEQRVPCEIYNDTSPE